MSEPISPKQIKKEYDNSIKKECTGYCKIALPLTEFSLLASGKYGRCSECKKCRNEKRKKINNPRKTEGTKYCPGENCHCEKPVEQFNAEKSALDGLQTYCKDCRHEINKKWASTFDGYFKKLFHDIKHNAKKRAKKLKIEITLNDIKDLYNKQKGLCVFTGKKMTRLAYQKKGDQHIINNWNISVNRIDSTKGYTKDNIQLVCAIINRMKTDLSDNQFLLICEKIYSKNFDTINKLIIESIKK